MALILPYIEEQQLFRVAERACAMDPEPTRNPPHVAFATVVQIYVCPSDSRLLSPQNDGFGNRAAYTSYIGIGGAIPRGRLVGLPGVLQSPGCRLSDITDGSSMTIMVGERPPPDNFHAGWWYPLWWWYSSFHGPNNMMIFGAGKMHLKDDGCRVTRDLGPGRTDNPCDRLHLWSLHGGGANFLFADGSGRFLSYSADPLMRGLATRAGGEVATMPE
jgi:prepilin-type processing-associated H-X9-DG protein